MNLNQEFSLFNPATEEDWHMHMGELDLAGFGRIAFGKERGNEAVTGCASFGAIPCTKILIVVKYLKVSKKLLQFSIVSVLPISLKQIRVFTLTIPSQNDCH